MTDLYMLLAVLLIALSVYYFLTAENPVKRLITVNILGSSVFLFLVAVARRVPGEQADPVPHALVLTGIVVSVSASALAVALLVYLRNGRE